MGGGCVSDRQRKAEDAVVPRISSGGLRAPRVVVIAAVVIVVVFNPPDVPLDEETASVAPPEEDRGEPRAVVLGPVRGRVVRKAVCNAQRWDVNRVAELSTVARFRVRLQTAKEKKEREKEKEEGKERKGKTGISIHRRMIHTRTCPS